MFEGVETAELRRQRNELMVQRDKSTDPGEKKRLADQMQAISDEIANRSLDAGKAARERVMGLEGRLDGERTKTPTDAVSAAVRGARDISDRLRPSSDDADDR